MVITLYGADSYRRIKKLNELVNSFIEKRGAVSHERFSLEEEEDFDRLNSFIRTPSMFSPKKLVVLDDPFEYPKTKELKDLLKTNTDEENTNIIINTEKKFKPAFKFLTESPNKFEEYNPLKGRELDKFIETEAKLLGISLKPNEIGLLKDLVGADTWRIMTELERVSLTQGKDVEDKGAVIEYFPTFNSLKYGNTTRQKLVALEQLLSGARYDAERIFNGLAFKPSNALEADMYADYNAAARAGRLEYDEALVAVALGLQFNPLDW
ncbi:hypothetical protein KKH05_01825 [Patescibacteria group bacterium]|nr:hypothetical protein [Patescibacteria group bacterium]